MSFVYPNLIEAMKTNNLSCSDLANRLNLSYMATYRRLRGMTDWKITEVVEVCRIFNEDRIDVLFLRLDTN